MGFSATSTVVAVSLPQTMTTSTRRTAALANRLPLGRRICTVLSSAALLLPRHMSSSSSSLQQSSFARGSGTGSSVAIALQPPPRAELYSTAIRTNSCHHHYSMAHSYHGNRRNGPGMTMTRGLSTLAANSIVLARRSSRQSLTGLDEQAEMDAQDHSEYETRPNSMKARRAIQRSAKGKRPSDATDESRRSSASKTKLARNSKGKASRQRQHDDRLRNGAPVPPAGRHFLARLEFKPRLQRSSHPEAHARPRKATSENPVKDLFADVEGLTSSPQAEPVPVRRNPAYSLPKAQQTRLVAALVQALMSNSTVSRMAVEAGMNVAEFKSGLDHYLVQLLQSRSVPKPTATVLQYHLAQMRAPTSEISTIPLPETYPSSMQAFGQDFVRYRATTLDQSVVSRISDMRQPQLTYHQARSMQRKFIFHAGPTNSGKTYSALKRFREANRGIYCAPLRLLALEVYDDTNNHGIPCDLVTGEDRKSGKGRPDEPQELNDSALDKLLRLPHLPKGDVASANPISLMDGDASTAAILGLDHASPKVPESIGLTLNSIFSSQAAETSSSQSDNDGGDTKATSSAQSSHVACTIEMADVDKVFDVAVIDEVQLIGDRDRGWAWTRALLGLAAHEIHVCGEPRALSIVESLLKSTGEDVQVHTYERLTPLVVAPHSINRNLANLRRGDAIIAFSRKELFRWKAEIERETRFRCAIVYGSLPPQTRAQQARLFNQPDSGFDILVATDAIGMGLNLNIGRIIFTTLQKFNGVSNVTLSPSEVRQIAGRAGRFRSKFPRGEFTTFEPEDMGILIKQFNGPADSLQAGLMANFEQLEALSKQLPGADMLDLFTKFEDLARLDKRYFMCDSSDRKEAIKLLAPLNLSFKDRYTFILAPANLENDYMRSCLLSFATGFEANRPITLAAITVPSTTSGAPSVLNEFEQCHKMLDLYMWLSYRFPQLFPDRDAAKQLQAQCAERIMEGLIEETRTGRRPKPQPRRRY